MKALRSLMKKVRKGEGGFTLIELLIVIIILGVLAAVVAFNVGGFLGAGTEETAKTEMATVQTAIIAGMADISCGELSDGGSVDPDDSTVLLTCTGGGNFTLETYLQLPTHGSWNWTAAGVVTDGSYCGGGKCCNLTGGSNWTCE